MQDVSEPLVSKQLATLGYLLVAKGPLSQNDQPISQTTRCVACPSRHAGFQATVPSRGESYTLCHCASATTWWTSSVKKARKYLSLLVSYRALVRSSTTGG